ncbi:MAG: tRNA uridine-5-carboxymethylaminomethyl(34) synthesis GTPase MnmE, partial [Leptolyngbyaceae cyanobacterium CAN_BIN12]|nr:tRNA uridine-5-carboxymethylaminomethyl(34) synthesis GTPase MnmE [Leptolyngbyaceae cyanobacterium CAN_BIN12]
PQAAQFALAGLQGKLADPIRQLRTTCIDILAEIEERVDFEEDLPPLNEVEIQTRLQQVQDDVDQILATADRGELIRSGLKVAIVGRPNVGKSSLLNAWSRSDRAIVTDLPGTTRDVVESNLVVGGIPIQVLDTAGIRDTDDKVEKIGVERSRTAAQSSDLVLLTIDAQDGWTDADQEIYTQVCDRPLILVINKTDLIESQEHSKPKIVPTETLREPNSKLKTQNSKLLTVSTAAALNQGIDALETAILTIVQTDTLQAANLDLAINQRQAATLTQTKLSLQQVQKTIADQLPLDFWTIDLRSAIYTLGQVLGEEVTESVLDKVFSRFCIGK